MIKLIKNEMKKILFSKKYLVAMVMLLILYIGLTCLVYKDITNSTPEARLENNKRYTEYLNKEKEDKKISERRKNEIEDKLKEIEAQNKYLQFERDTKGIDWQKKLIKENKVLEDKIQKIEKEDSSLQKSQHIQKLKANEYCIKNNIKPTESYEVNGFNMMGRVNSLFSIIIVGVIVAIISADSISGEFNPATIKLLLTKPISRERILLSKFIAAIIVSLGSFMILRFTMFLIIGIIFTFGNYKEPLAFYGKYINDEDLIARIGYGVKPDINSIKIYSVLKVTMLSEVFSLLFIMACTSINFLISTIARKSSSSIGIALIISVVTSIISISQLSGDIGKNQMIHSIAPYLFSTYSSGELVVQGEVMRALGVNFANSNFAIIILLMWTGICYTISNFIFVKKDII